MYLQPRSLDEACRALSEHSCTIVCGATDLYAADLAGRHGDVMLDVSKVPELLDIKSQDGGVRLGAAVRWALLRDALLPPNLAGLQVAAGMIGGHQIQNRGTIGGNICNASPAADGVPPLLAADAQVELVSLAGIRHMPLSDFLRPSRPSLKIGEMLSAVMVRGSEGRVASAFEKLGSRRDLVISVVSVAVHAEWDNSECLNALRIAVGGASRVPLRLYGLEARLTATPEELGRAPVSTSDLAELTPISDLRATASYRRHAAAVILNRLLDRISKELVAHA